MVEPSEVVHVESRWPVALTTIFVLALTILLPDRIRALPGWVPCAVAITLIVPMAALELTRAKTQWLRIERIAMLVFFVSGGFGIIDELRYLLVSLSRRSANVTGLQLLVSSVAVWAANVLLFSIAYWRTDRGGPEARLNEANTKPDWLFPHEIASETAAPDWSPAFIDYLFLAYWTATAFSPTDALPVTRRAKLLMMCESMVSLVTIIVVAARAINMIGS